MKRSEIKVGEEYLFYRTIHIGRCKVLGKSLFGLRLFVEYRCNLYFDLETCIHGEDKVHGNSWSWRIKSRYEATEEE